MLVPVILAAAAILDGPPRLGEHHCECPEPREENQQVRGRLVLTVHGSYIELERCDDILRIVYNDEIYASEQYKQILMKDQKNGLENPSIVASGRVILDRDAIVRMYVVNIRLDE